MEQFLQWFQPSSINLCTYKNACILQLKFRSKAITVLLYSYVSGWYLSFLQEQHCDHPKGGPGPTSPQDYRVPAEDQDLHQVEPRGGQAGRLLPEAEGGPTETVRQLQISQSDTLEGNGWIWVWKWTIMLYI